MVNKIKLLYNYEILKKKSYFLQNILNKSYHSEMNCNMKGTGLIR